VPDYPNIGDVKCVYLSIRFGKRFGNHGLIEGGGMFHLPDYSIFESLVQQSLPQNSHAPRFDIAVPLNLVELHRIEPLIRQDGDERFKQFLGIREAGVDRAVRGLEGVSDHAPAWVDLEEC
jgi:hypothetical protein